MTSEPSLKTCVSNVLASFIQFPSENYQNSITLRTEPGSPTMARNVLTMSHRYSSEYSTNLVGVFGGTPQLQFASTICLYMICSLATSMHYGIPLHSELLAPNLKVRPGSAFEGTVFFGKRSLPLSALAQVTSLHLDLAGMILALML